MATYKVAILSFCTLSIIALTGCGQRMGQKHAYNPPPKPYPAYFKSLTTFGVYDVNNPRMAEGPHDGQTAVVETHGSLTLDIGHDLSFYSTGTPDITIYMPDNRPANYTVHVRHATHGKENWTEIGRGHGGGTANFDMDPYYSGAADYIQIRNEGTEPLYIDAVKASSVRHD